MISFRAIRDRVTAEDRLILLDAFPIVQQKRFVVEHGDEIHEKNAVPVALRYHRRTADSRTVQTDERPFHIGVGVAVLVDRGQTAPLAAEPIVEQIEPPVIVDPAEIPALFLLFFFIF